MAEEISVGGITVPLSHPDKVLFPDDGIAEADKRLAKLDA